MTTAIEQLAPGPAAAPPNGDLAIDLAEVAKTYRGRVRALRGISMRVHRGEIFGLLGPNGAGKSTLVKILMTVIRPTRCRGTMLGAAVGHKQTLGRVGYLPEHHRFPEYLTGWQVMDYFGALADVPRQVRRRRADELLELVGMREWQGKRVKGYSKGMRQRLGVAQALVNDPELVLLDEPTDGVDPVGRRDIRTVLVEMRRRGKTVLLNSHLLSELELVCDRVAILVQGMVSSQGTLEELTTYGRRYELEVEGNGSAGKVGAAEGFGAVREALVAAGVVRGLELTGSLDDLARMAQEAPPTAAATAPARVGRPVMRGTLASGEAVELDGQTIRVATDEAGAVQAVIDALRGRGLVLRSVRPIRPSLEDLFMRAVTDPATGRALLPGAAPASGRVRGGAA